MTKNTTTNTATILLLEADNRAAHHIRRTEAAHRRHPNRTHIWTITPDGIRPTIDRQNGTQLHRTADTAAFLAIRARHASSGLDLFAQLTAAAGNDRNHRNIEQTATAALEAEQERNEQRAAQHYHESQAARVTITPAEAKAHREKAKAARRAADRAAAKADSLNKLISTATASDREPLVQAAALGALEYIEAHRADLDPEAIFPAMCAAAGREIANIAAPDAAQSTRTKVKEITPEKAAELRQAYPDIIIVDPATGLEISTPCRIPHNVKGATSQCFDTVELRERGRKPNRRLVWCLVSHYLTVAPYVSYEAFTEQSGGDTYEIATNGGLNAIGTQEEAAEIADFIRRANLTEKEAAIVYKAADQTAALHGQAAAAEYWQKRTPEIAAITSKKERNKAHKAAQATADRKRTAAQWVNACERQGVKSERTQSDIRSRVKTLLEAAQNPKELRTQAEQDERAAKLWERMQRSPSRGNPTKEAPRADFVGMVCPAAIPAAPVLYWTPGKGWTYRPTKRAAEAAQAFTTPTAAPVIKWTESGAEPEAITPGKDYRAAEVERRAAATGGKASPPAMTERERTQWEKLCKSEAETMALWRKFEEMNGRTPDRAAKLPKVDTTTAEAKAEAERMRAAAAKLTKVKSR